MGSISKVELDESGEPLLSLDSHPRLNIEVRDSQAVHLVPVRHGLEALSDGKRGCWDTVAAVAALAARRAAWADGKIRALCSQAARCCHCGGTGSWLSRVAARIFACERLGAAKLELSRAGPRFHLKFLCACIDFAGARSSLPPFLQNSTYFRLRARRLCFLRKPGATHCLAAIAPRPQRSCLLQKRLRRPPALASVAQSSARLPAHAGCCEAEKSKAVQEQWAPQNIVGDMYFSISCI